MNNPLSEIYLNKVFVTEKQALEKSTLQNPGDDQIGKLPKEDLFGVTPKVAGEGPAKVKGIDKAAKGPVVQQTTGTGTKIDSPKGNGGGGGTNTGSSQKASTGSEGSSKMPNSGAAKDPTVSKGKEMEDTDVDPSDEDKEEPKKKKEIKEESFTMSAFETLFKKTINENEEEPIIGDEGGDIGEIGLEGEGPDDALDLEDEGGEDEGDLVSDLRDLQAKLGDILAKLEGSMDEEAEDAEGEEYSDEEFDEEFADEGEGEDEGVTESLGKPQLLSHSKGKTLQQKSNKVKSKLSSTKKGKAHIGKLKNEPKPKALGDKKAPLMKGTGASSSIKKGDSLFQ